MGQNLEDMRRQLTALRAKLGWHGDPERPPFLQRSDGSHQTSADFDSPETIAARLRARKHRSEIVSQIVQLEAAIEALNPDPPTLPEKIADQILYDFVVKNGRKPTRDERIIESQRCFTHFAKMVERGQL